VEILASSHPACLTIKGACGFLRKSSGRLTKQKKHRLQLSVFKNFNNRWDVHFIDCLAVRGMKRWQFT
jgi:hypothetical protein